MVAGVSVALVAIPQSLAYAELAGLPAQHGLFASALPSIAAAAFVIPLIAGRLRLPAIVVELVFGVVVGPVLGIIEPGGELLEFLAELGLLLLMFLAGFEIDFTKLERQGPATIIGGLVMVGLFLGVGWFGVGFLDTSSTEERLFLTFLLGAAAIGLVAPALRETRRAGTRLGQLILPRRPGLAHRPGRPGRSYQ